MTTSTPEKKLAALEHKFRILEKAFQRLRAENETTKLAVLYISDKLQQFVENQDLPDYGEGVWSTDIPIIFPQPNTGITTTSHNKGTCACQKKKTL